MPLSLIRHPLASSLRFASKFGKSSKAAFKPAFGSFSSTKVKALAGRYPKMMTKTPPSTFGRSRQMRDTFEGALDLRRADDPWQVEPFGAPKLSPGAYRDLIKARKRVNEAHAIGARTMTFNIVPAVPKGEVGEWLIRATNSSTLGTRAVGNVENIKGPYAASGQAASATMKGWEQTLGRTSLERRRNVKRLFMQAGAMGMLPPKIVAIQGYRATGVRAQRDFAQRLITDSRHTRVPLPGRGLTMKSARESLFKDFPEESAIRLARVARMREGGGAAFARQAPRLTPAQQASQAVAASRALGTATRATLAAEATGVRSVVGGQATGPVLHTARREGWAVRRDAAARAERGGFETIASTGMGGTSGSRTLVQDTRLPSPQRQTRVFRADGVPGYRTGGVSGPIIPYVSSVLSGEASFPSRLTRQHYQAIAGDMRAHLLRSYGDAYATSLTAIGELQTIAGQLQRNSNFHRRRFTQAVMSGRDANVR